MVQPSKPFPQPPRPAGAYDTCGLDHGLPLGARRGDFVYPKALTERQKRALRREWEARFKGPPRRGDATIIYDVRILREQELVDQLIIEDRGMMWECLTWILGAVFLSMVLWPFVGTVMLMMARD